MRSSPAEKKKPMSLELEHIVAGLRAIADKVNETARMLEQRKRDELGLPREPKTYLN